MGMGKEEEGCIEASILLLRGGGGAFVFIAGGGGEGKDREWGDSRHGNGTAPSSRSDWLDIRTGTRPQPARATVAVAAVVGLAWG
ncbi:unnamed protein product [Lampetra fluviatilis]